MHHEPLVDRAEATLGVSDRCSFCVVMLAVPSAIACAEVGDLDQARHYAQVAEGSAARWPGTAWAAAATEARAHIARAEGNPSESAALLHRGIPGIRVRRTARRLGPVPARPGEPPDQRALAIVMISRTSAAASLR